MLGPTESLQPPPRLAQLCWTCFHSQPEGGRPLHLFLSFCDGLFLPSPASLSFYSPALPPLSTAFLSSPAARTGEHKLCCMLCVSLSPSLPPLPPPRAATLFLPVTPAICCFPANKQRVLAQDIRNLRFSPSLPVFRSNIHRMPHDAPCVANAH